LARLRAVVPTFETHGTQGSDYSYGIPTIEEPGRAITQLRNLARGHALLKGRNYITSDDIPIVIKVVLSTTPIERATIFDILIANKGSLTTSKIIKSLNITAHTAHKTMIQLSALGLVDGTGLTEKSNTEKKIELKDEFSWFLSEEFQRIRESFDSEEEQQQPRLQ
jgi:predicted transcriptional regulator